MENALSTRRETRTTILNFLPNTLESLSTIKQEIMKETNVDDLMKEKFLCPTKFAEEIEKIVKSNNFNHIDAILTYCEENKVEIEAVSKLMSKPLKEKLKYDALQLNFMKRTSRAKLPI